MAMENMQSGRCSICEGGEVYETAAAGNFGLRKPGAMVSQGTSFTVLVCATCGYMQWHVSMDEKQRDWLRKKARRVQPQAPQ
ncbi:hypothetical protein ACFPA8_23925 [Streptomyces ovatisporus]|uniref:Uncharacterized protein n=1 Tax=Streptomyces ovatisporus TaxID=1128682 RepID=A0ABV9AB95_9ACTN